MTLFLFFLTRTIAQVANPFITVCIVNQYFRYAVGNFYHRCPMVQMDKSLVLFGKILKTSPGSSFLKLDGKAEKTDWLHVL